MVVVVAISQHDNKSPKKVSNYTRCLFFFLSCLFDCEFNFCFYILLKILLLYLRRYRLFSPFILEWFPPPLSA